jgi:hypothetical protein
MPFKKGKGKKKFKKKTPGYQRELVTRDKVIEEQKSQGNDKAVFWYGRVDKILSGERVLATCFIEDNNKMSIEVHITKKLRRARPKKGHYLLISIRQFNHSQADVVVFYTDDEVKKLLKQKLIPRDDSEDTRGIMFVTELDNDNDNDNKHLTKAEKTKLRRQRQNNNNGVYLDMDNIFNEDPSDTSIFNKFIDSDDELVKKTCEFIKNKDTNKNNNTNTSDNSESEDESDDESDYDSIEINVEGQCTEQNDFM